MSRAILFLLAICLAGVAPVRVAYAQDAAMKTAKKHYERGQKLFALQKFDEALEQFQMAFDAKPIPDFLFNIGQCHRNLGNYEAAIFSFKRYLKLDPDASNREKVEDLITQLEEKVAAEEAEKQRLEKEKDQEKPLPPPPPITEPPPKTSGSPFYKKWWFWTGVVVVGAAGGAGYYMATAGGPPDTSLGRNIVFGR
jgi:tetratricopeptide (TPR) repeat protein